MGPSNSALRTLPRKALGESWQFIATRYWHPLSTKYWYRFFTRYLSSDDAVFLNWGYEEDPPMGIPLDEADEPNRYFIQLYHTVAAQVDLTGKRVLEVSCGHGGGASYIMRTLKPESYTGLDLNPAGIEFCQRRHQMPGLNFVQGHAEDLPFADESFDAVINIEASHCYPQFPQFLSEVARVLRPGGHLLFADCDYVASPRWDELSQAPLREISQRSISVQVGRALKQTWPRLHSQSRHIPAFYHDKLLAKIFDELGKEQISYRTYCFVKD